MSKGGKRWGAGRPGWHVKAEQCLRLDVRHWQRDGLLAPGRMGEWEWRDATGHKVAGVTFTVTDGAVTLTRGGRLPSGVRGNVATLGAAACPPAGNIATQVLPITRTACHFGGDRPWFACPQCHRRAAVLYLRDHFGFACRPCAQVAYASQSEDAIARAWRCQGKVEGRLGAHGSKPPGMHRTTHAKLAAKISACEQRRLAALVAWLPSHRRPA